jgi:hypothetical protein
MDIANLQQAVILANKLSCYARRNCKLCFLWGVILIVFPHEMKLDTIAVLYMLEKSRIKKLHACMGRKRRLNVIVLKPSIQFKI